MREQQTIHFVGLDVGTSMIRCVVGMIDAEGGTPSIIGHGSAPNLGMRKGIVVHVDDVANAITHAVQEAERISGVTINRATICVNGSHINGVNSRGVIAISTANREITTEDRMRVEEAATIVQLPPNREIIQVFANNYRVDGQDNIKDPVGMRGVRLEVDTHIVTAATPNLRSLDLVMEKAGIIPAHHTVNGLAAAEAVLNRQQKESGTLLLDIGAGTTNFVVVEDGEIQHVAVIPMGGIHITNDLAIGLKTDLEIAEKVKLEHGGVGKSKKSAATVVHENKHHVFDADEVTMIIEARVEELLEFIEKELRKIGKARKLPGGVVLVGGTSKLPGLAEFAKEKLQLAARTGSLQPITGLVDAVQDPGYVSPIGLMLLDMLLGQTEQVGHISRPDAGLLGMVSGVLRRFRRP